MIVESSDGLPVGDSTIMEYWDKAGSHQPLQPHMNPRPPPLPNYPPSKKSLAAWMGHHCGPAAGRNSIHGPSMLFPQHLWAIVAVRRRRATASAGHRCGRPGVTGFLSGGRRRDDTRPVFTFG